jgi:hypothetical protein
LLEIIEMTVGAHGGAEFTGDSRPSSGGHCSLVITAAHLTLYSDEHLLCPAAALFADG